MKAVIIAAGCGSRLKKMHKGIPKTLIEVNGIRLIDDIISKITNTGIDEIIIITGYKSEILKPALSEYEKKISFVFNPEWEKANGLSVLCAKDHIDEHEQFILLMSDHIFSFEMLKQVINAEISNDEALLALDFKIESIPDLDDGMKVQCSLINDRIYNINKFGKNLSLYQAIDAGMFKLNYSFFSALEKSINNGKCSLSDACNIFAQRGKMKGVDIGKCLWLDVDTPEMIQQKDILSKIIGQ